MRNPSMALAAASPQLISAYPLSETPSLPLLRAHMYVWWVSAAIKKSKMISSSSVVVFLNLVHFNLKSDTSIPGEGYYPNCGFVIFSSGKFR
ncbi:hypothetical protein Nepgr_023707 [Nepenthes gracilis]|uniref:Uncharacterized protein n=1 Tax=Nepenthes gracilis TaxID=150966 RepID=A0AAD3T398_NEPGR|nr:hypothetical protein Nepgr_023707 [Nepenthes gracilis]